MFDFLPLNVDSRTYLFALHMHVQILKQFHAKILDQAVKKRSNWVQTMGTILVRLYPLHDSKLQL